MYAYRITNQKFKDSTLSGIGAELVGGRWNEKGTRAVYCSENMALALLEYYAHGSDLGVLPRQICIAKILIPEDFELIKLQELPHGWNQYPYSSKSSGVFSKLAGNRDFFGIKVPSAILPYEHNLILNPLYQDFGKVMVEEFLNLRFDSRFNKKT